MRLREDQYIQVGMGPYHTSGVESCEGYIKRRPGICGCTGGASGAAGSAAPPGARGGERAGGRMTRDAAGRPMAGGRGVPFVPPGGPLGVRGMMAGARMHPVQP